MRLEASLRRFWSNVVKTETCWLWTAKVNTDGVGGLKFRGEQLLAHRFSWELTHGPIPEALRLVRSCLNKTCVNPSHYRAMSSEDLFWSHVNKNGKIVRKELGHCWEWTLSTHEYGYGQVTWNGIPGRRTHRVAWVIAYGDLPDEACVLHKCDNPLCVRPDHLFLGSKTDNNRDCHEKDRYRGCAPKGSHHPKSKLAESDIPKIRAMLKAGKPVVEVAKHFGMSRSMIGFIRAGKNWSHVP